MELSLLNQDLNKLIEVVGFELEKDKRITALYLFGSAVNGKMNRFSDLDFGILYSKNISKDEILTVHYELDDKIEKILYPLKYDLVIMNNAPIRFNHNIISTGKLIFCNDKAHLVDFVYKNNYEYLDFIYYRNQFTDYFIENFKY